MSAGCSDIHRLTAAHSLGHKKQSSAQTGRPISLKVCFQSRAAQRRGTSTTIQAQADGSKWEEGFSVPDEERAGSEEWRKRRPAVTLPPFARKAEHTFLLAAFLKIMLLATVVPTNKIFKPLGYTPTGIMAWLVMLPVAALLTFLASSILKSNFMKRRGSGFAVLLVCWGLIAGAGKLYVPRPQPRQPGVTRSAAASAQQREEALRAAAMRSPHLRTAEDSDRMWAEEEARRGRSRK